MISPRLGCADTCRLLPCSGFSRTTTPARRAQRVSGSSQWLGRPNGLSGRPGPPAARSLGGPDPPRLFPPRSPSRDGGIHSRAVPVPRPPPRRAGAPRLFPPPPAPRLFRPGRPPPSAPRPPRALGSALRGRGGRGRHAEQPLPRPGALTLQGLEDRLRHLGAAAARGEGAGLRKHCGNRGVVMAARGRPGAGAEPPAPETQPSWLSCQRPSPHPLPP